MARIDFQQTGHRYNEGSPYALKPMTHSWEDGGAYALLGPSGCGKTTLLNICSGLLRPSDGRVLFDGRDVTDVPTQGRNIAQVFQFPVIYDTMTVFDNLAFPLRNRGVEKVRVRERVRDVAKMLEIDRDLGRRAKELTADEKQLISMGRGLVRDDVAAILFDEPLTVIDPQLKWKLRRQLKRVHQNLGLTLIYVTHDQTEALTFADKVVVMSDGEIMQIGSPQALFERPEHTFVGYFIGSPGMNFFPCELDGAEAVIGDSRLPLPEDLASRAHKTGARSFKLGIRPEFVGLAADDEPGIAARVEQIEELGRFRVVTARVGEHRLVAKLSEDAEELGSDRPRFRFPQRWLCLYVDERLVEVEGETANA